MFGAVPKHFYSNYKTNMMRDAHHLAKSIVENTLKDTDRDKLSCTST